MKRVAQAVEGARLIKAREEEAHVKKLFARARIEAEEFDARYALETQEKDCFAALDAACTNAFIALCNKSDPKSRLLSRFPGGIDFAYLNELCEKIAVAIAASKKIILSLDLDGTLVLYGAKIHGRLKWDINKYLMAALVMIFTRFHPKHFDIIITSSRCHDDLFPSGSPYPKMNEVVAKFLDQLKRGLPHEIHEHL